MNTTLYRKRLKEHLESAKILCQKNDYVQAGEKVWGALTALVNTLAKQEIKPVHQKRKLFVLAATKHLAKTPDLRSQMLRLRFRKEREVFQAVFGLHVFFYGGQDYSNQQASKTIPFFIQLLESLWQSECPQP